MALIDRLLAGDNTKIPVHAFHAALGEWARGRFTRDEIYLGSTLRVQRVDLTSADVLHQVLLLGESRQVYADAAAVRARLGL